MSDQACHADQAATGGSRRRTARHATARALSPNAYNISPMSAGFESCAFWALASSTPTAGRVRGAVRRSADGTLAAGDRQPRQGGTDARCRTREFLLFIAPCRQLPHCWILTLPNLIFAGRERQHVGGGMRRTLNVESCLGQRKPCLSPYLFVLTLNARSSIV